MQPDPAGQPVEIYLLDTREHMQEDMYTRLFPPALFPKR